MKKSPVEIVIVTRLEGLLAECEPVTFPTWATASSYVRGTALTAPEPKGCYDKTLIQIRWSDGTTFSFRLDVTRDHAKTDDPITGPLKAHAKRCRQLGGAFPDLDLLETRADEIIRTP